MQKLPAPLSPSCPNVPPGCQNELAKRQTYIWHYTQLLSIKGLTSSTAEEIIHTRFMRVNIELKSAQNFTFLFHSCQLSDTICCIVASSLCLVSLLSGCLFSVTNSIFVCLFVCFWQY